MHTQVGYFDKLDCSIPNWWALHYLVLIRLWSSNASDFSSFFFTPKHCLPFMQLVCDLWYLEMLLFSIKTLQNSRLKLGFAALFQVLQLSNFIFKKLWYKSLFAICYNYISGSTNFTGKFQLHPTPALKVVIWLVLKFSSYSIMSDHQRVTLQWTDTQVKNFSQNTKFYSFFNHFIFSVKDQDSYLRIFHKKGTHFYTFEKANKHQNMTHYSCIWI